MIEGRKGAFSREESAADVPCMQFVFDPPAHRVRWQPLGGGGCIGSRCTPSYYNKSTTFSTLPPYPQTTLRFVQRTVFRSKYPLARARRTRSKVPHLGSNT